MQEPINNFSKARNTLVIFISFSFQIKKFLFWEAKGESNAEAGVIHCLKQLGKTALKKGGRTD